MRFDTALFRTALCLLVTAAAACGSDEPDEAPATDSAPAMTAAPEPSVSIVAPADGDTVSGGAVTVRMEATGVEIRPAGEVVDGTGHHHIFLDADVSEPGAPVPTVPGAVVHLGDGSAEYTFEDVAPGEHRLIAVVADGLHVPLQPWVVDTVMFVVR